MSLKILRQLNKRVCRATFINPVLKYAQCSASITYCFLVELENSDGQWQNEEMTISNMTAQHLKFTVESAYDHFVAVQKVHVDGNAVQG
jgi:hypothetical protein